jgi:hypothetical protein
MFLVVCVLVFVTSFAALAQPPGEKLPILETYLATVDNDKQPESKTGFIAAETEWKEVWAKVSSKKLPEVDFGKHLLLIGRQDAADPNRRSASVVKDEEGVVTLSIVTTLIGFESSDRTIFTFYKVSREGVTGVRRFDAKQKKMVVEPLP